VVLNLWGKVHACLYRSHNRSQKDPMSMNT